MVQVAVEYCMGWGVHFTPLQNFTATSATHTGCCMEVWAVCSKGGTVGSTGGDTYHKGTEMFVSLHVCGVCGDRWKLGTEVVVSLHLCV